MRCDCGATEFLVGYCNEGNMRQGTFVAWIVSDVGMRAGCSQEASQKVQAHAVCHCQLSRQLVQLGTLAAGASSAADLCSMA